MPDSNVPVLIAGGGPVGLATSFFLARLGIPSLLVERHSSTTLHPRARGMNIRTMEVFRSVGLAEAVLAAGCPLTEERYTLSVETLAGKELQRILPQGAADNYKYVSKLSPENWCLCAQDELEPLLLTAASQYASDLRFSTELVSFEQDSSGVTARIKHRVTGIEETVHAAYMVAADGAGSRIRQMLQVSMIGEEILAHYVNIYFRADLSNLVRNRLFVMCHVENPEARGIFFTVNDTDRWLFNVPYTPETGMTPDDFPPSRCIDLIRKAVGIPDIDVEILSILPWDAATCMADNFLIGRVFLAGDAAHVMPPFGASGINIGVQDVHNLAWKLAMVLKDLAGPALLTTYDTERRAIGLLTMGQADYRHKGIMGRSASDSISKTAPSFEEQVKVMLGYHYTSPAIVAEEVSFSSDETDFNGRPGTRAPHLWLVQEGKRISILDLFDKHFVLLTGEEGTEWDWAAKVVGNHLGIKLVVYHIGKTGDLVDPQDRWCSLYGIETDGAVLVRPDGFVGWRTQKAEGAPELVLERVLQQILAR